MFSSSRRAMSAAVLVCIGLLAASPATAQSDGYPGKRVRPLHIYANANNAPQSTMTEARVILRKFTLEPGRGAMRISGECWSDFDVEAGHNVPSGQLMGLEIEVSLHLLNSDTDDKDGEIVSGQRVFCKTSTTEDVAGLTLGVAKFELPDMERPLPPGVYRLRCRAMAANQPKPIKDALKWVPDMYGVWVEYGMRKVQEMAKDPVSGKMVGVMEKDPTTGKVVPKMISELYETERFNVYERAATLDKVYKEVVESEVFESKGTLFLGNVVRGTSVVLDAKSFLCRNAHFEMLRQLENYEAQRKSMNEMIDMDRKNPDLPPEVKKKKEEDYKRDMASIDVLERRCGGKRDSKELSTYSFIQVSMAAVRDQIIAWEDDLALKYWYLVDGVLNYGWHCVNHPGRNMYIAVDSNNNVADKEARKKKLEDLEKAEGAKEARDAKRDEAWKYIPANIKSIAFEYVRRKEASDDFDSDRFTKKEGKYVVVDVTKWTTYRNTFLAKFKKDAKAALDAVDVSRIYSIQKWGDVFDKCKEARDAVITHTYLYERSARILLVEKIHEKDADARRTAVADLDKVIAEEWDASVTAEELKEMRPLFSKAKSTAAGLSQLFDQAIKVAKKGIDVEDYAYRYKFIFEKKPAPLPRRYGKK